MLIESIQTELARLRIHPVNLAATTTDDRLIALRGSLLRYWKIPEAVDANWFLESLKQLPDDAGPAAVMNALFASPDAEPVAAH